LTVIHGGDFQQILPVIIKGKKEDVIEASLQQSYLWDSMKIITLHVNMHLESSAEEVKFAHTGWYHGRLRARAWVGTL